MESYDRALTAERVKVRFGAGGIPNPKVAAREARAEKPGPPRRLVGEPCPANTAGLQVGDVIREVNGESISGLANLFRRIWRRGEAGVEVPLTIVRNRESMSVTVRSTDRDSCLKSASIH